MDDTFSLPQQQDGVVLCKDKQDSGTASSVVTSPKTVIINTAELDFGESPAPPPSPPPPPPPEVDDDDEDEAEQQEELDTAPTVEIATRRSSTNDKGIVDEQDDDDDDAQQQQQQQQEQDDNQQKKLPKKNSDEDVLIARDEAAYREAEDTTDDSYALFMDAVLWRLVHSGVNAVNGVDVEGLVRDTWARCGGQLGLLPERMALLEPAEVARFVARADQVEAVASALKAPAPYADEDAHVGPRRDDDEPSEYYEVVKRSYDGRARAKMERAFAMGDAEVCQLSIGSESFCGDAVFSKREDDDTVDKIARLQYASTGAKARLAGLERDANATYRRLSDFHRRLVSLEKVVRQLALHNAQLQRRLADSQQKPFLKNLDYYAAGLLLLLVTLALGYIRAAASS